MNCTTCDRALFYNCKIMSDTITDEGVQVDTIYEFECAKGHKEYELGEYPEIIAHPKELWGEANNDE